MTTKRETPPSAAGPNDGLESLWDEIVRFNDFYFPGWRKQQLIYYSNALAGEVGEFCNSTKHMIGGGTNGSNPTYVDLMEELAESFIYLLLSAERLGAGREAFEDSVRRKMRINRERMERRRPSSC